MIRHVVCLTWKTGVTDAEIEVRDHHLQAGQYAVLVALPGQIPEIRAYTVGSDLAIMDGNADFAIVADFDDADALRRYQHHPAHRAVLDGQIFPILASRAGVQLEIGP